MQLSFFAHAMKFRGGKKSMKFLNEMKEIIPFEAIEKILIEKNVYKPNKGKTGRPSIPSKILIGSLFLQNWYGLSDPITEELIHDHRSFRKFLEIKILFLIKQLYASLVTNLSKKNYLVIYLMK